MTLYNILLESRLNESSSNLMDNLESYSKLSSNLELTKFESSVLIIMVFFCGKTKTAEKTKTLKIRTDFTLHVYYIFISIIVYCVEGESE